MVIPNKLNNQKIHSKEFKLESSSHLNQAQQVLERHSSLSEGEYEIKSTIEDCLRNWHEPWKKTYLAGGDEYKIVYDLMEGLFHYESQITCSQTKLSSERINAIARAVARLVDYGNAILNIDLIIRVQNETSSVLDPTSVTTIELFQAHIKAHYLRKKLLRDYFRKDEQNTNSDLHHGIDDKTNASANTSTTSSSNLHHLSPLIERLHRASIGSIHNINSTNHHIKRRASQNIPPSQVELKNSNDTNLSKKVDITHMTTIIKTEAFLSSHCSATRATLLPGILNKIKHLMNMHKSVDELESCFELLDALLDSVERLPIESRSNEVAIISKALLKPIVRKVHIDDRYSLIEFQHAHWTVILISLIRLMTIGDFKTYLRHFNGSADVGEFIREYLFLVKQLLSNNDRKSLLQQSEQFEEVWRTFPSYWIEMTLLACSTFLTSLTYLYHVLRDDFGPNLQMWSSYIDCLINLILHDTLNPNRLMLKERQRLLADDLAQSSVEYIWISWDSLEFDQKQQLPEELLESLIKTCMTLKSKQRSILLPIFYDMMRCNYTTQYITPRGSNYNSAASSTASSSQLKLATVYNSNDGLYLDNYTTDQLAKSTTRVDDSLPYLSNPDYTEDGTVLTRFTHLIVEKLNSLMIDSDYGDELFKKELCLAIAGDLNPKYHNCSSFLDSADTNQFRSMARQTSDLIAEFMQICLDCRQANKLSYGHLYLLCIFKLILFFRDKVDIPDLYVNNLSKLFLLHHGAARYVEAGFTLLEYAKALPWSEQVIDNHHRFITRNFQNSEPLTNYISLKIFLYNIIIEYFNQGQMWEEAMPLFRELQDIYQTRTYEYDKLAELLQKMSNFYNNILCSGDRCCPEYFRVTFYGKGFPSSIRNSTMVYRGKAYEKLGDFQSTMLAKYPDAKLLTSLSRPEESTLQSSDSRYLQINACLPIIELQSKFTKDLGKIEENVLNFYRHNQCDKFKFSRRINPPSLLASNSEKPLKLDDNFANMWRETTTLTTNTLPGMLPFFPVFLIETSVVSPIESAIEDLERTNDRLSCMVSRFKTDKQQREDVRLLGQLLLGIVDAAVNGGITKYEEAFFESKITSQQHQCSPVFNLEGSFSTLSVSMAKGGDYSKQAVNNRHLLDPLAPPIPIAFAGHDSNNRLVKDDVQVEKLKCLIAKQVPLLDEAITLHSIRIDDIMRPQHEHLETSYKRFKDHIITNYSKYLPQDYSRTLKRKFKSSTRSPNRSLRADSRLMQTMINGTNSMPRRLISDRETSNVPVKNNEPNLIGINISPTSIGSIPYKQFTEDRKSLPNLTNDTQLKVPDRVMENRDAYMILPTIEFTPVEELLTPDSGLGLNSQGKIENNQLNNNILEAKPKLDGRRSFKINQYEEIDDNNINATNTGHFYTRLFSDNNDQISGGKEKLISEENCVGETNLGVTLANDREKPNESEPKLVLF